MLLVSTIVNTPNVDFFPLGGGGKIFRYAALLGLISMDSRRVEIGLKALCSLPFTAQAGALGGCKAPL